VRAIVHGAVVAESGDTIWCAGYCYFPRAAVRAGVLEPVPLTDKDRACPHGVQFYDVVIGGDRYPGAAWSYEAPQPSMMPVAGRIGFWKDVEVTE
jgi:uncharacterized protein (DUF427 family)